jgi:inorganic phosphate transporter, PiT family
LDSDVVLAIVVSAALAFGFTNGYHDSAQVVAASISTRALSPRMAVVIAAVLNFAGALISLEVAATIAENIVEVGEITPTVIFAGLAAAIALTVGAAYLDLPSSSSHALIGAVVGAAFAAGGAGAVIGAGVLGDVLVPALAAPLAAFVVGLASIAIAYRIVGRLRPGPVNRGYRLGQVASGGLLALAHGANDGQKTMGVIVLALVANGNLSATGFEVPLWVIVSAAIAIGAGTYAGGSRSRTAGTRIIKIDAAQGFSAQGAAAAVILASTHLGFPLSTTHVISGSLIGAGAGRRFSAVRWGVAGNLLAVWLFTLPVAAAVGAGTYGVTRIFGTGAVGPVVVLLCAATAALALLARRVHRSRRVPAR